MREPLYNSAGSGTSGSISNIKFTELKSDSVKISFTVVPPGFSLQDEVLCGFQFSILEETPGLQQNPKAYELYFAATQPNNVVPSSINFSGIKIGNTSSSQIESFFSSNPIFNQGYSIDFGSFYNASKSLQPSKKYTLRIYPVTVNYSFPYSEEDVLEYFGKAIEKSFTTPKATKVSTQKPQAKAVVIPHGAHIDGPKTPQKKTTTSTKKTKSKSKSDSKSSNVGQTPKTTTKSVKSSSAPTAVEKEEIKKSESKEIPKQPIIPVLKTTIPDIQNSVLAVTNNSIDPEKISIAIKNMAFPKTFNGLIPGILTYGTQNYKYFGFGTTLFLDFNEKKPEQAGGLGFFTNDIGTDGYFVFVRSTARKNTGDQRDVYVVKVVGGEKTILKDTQTTDSKRVTAIYGGETYNISAFVNDSSVTERKIVVYVNEKRFVATDPDPENLPVTTYVGMFAQKGTVNFDYIYAYPLTEEEYKNPKKLLGKNGKIENQAMSFLFGNRVFNSFSQDHIGTMLEFGTTAKEIKQIKTKYEKKPGYMKYAGKGINPHIEILGTKSNNFGFEMFLMNNTGGQVPASDGDSLSYYVVGKQVYKSGQLEYKTDLLGDSAGLEPIIFDSSWIQKEEDAKKLADWIKTQWSNKQVLVNMSVFGNPIISPGDIVKIIYPRPGLTDGMRFLVTDVTLRYAEGLETDLVCRAIYG